jgi:DNA-binding GntR family transcriptional regulator
MALASKKGPSQEPLRLVETAYREIKRRILLNQYPGGFQILEDALAGELSMSRTPLKEAIVRLRNEGLVEILPRRGMRVLPLNADDVADIFEVLSVLEILSIRLIARRKGNADSVQRLRAHVEAMKAALDRDDLDAWAAADESFHRALVDESRNPRLAMAARTLLDQSQRFRIFTLRLREKPVRSTKSHEALVSALRRNDSAKAEAEHSVHKRNWHDHMRELMKKFGIRHI